MRFYQLFPTRHKLSNDVMNPDSNDMLKHSNRRD